MGEGGGCEIDEADEARFEAAGGDAGAADEERHVEAFDGEPLFAPRHRAAVVGEEKNERVIKDAGFGELGEDDADALIDGFDAALVSIPVAAHERVVRVVGREGEAGECGGVVGVRNGEGAMGLGDLKLGEEGLAGLAFPPVVAVEHLGGIVGEVVVGFPFLDDATAAHRARGGGVGDEPAGLAEERGEVAVGRGERLGIFDVVGVEARGDLRGAEDKGGARRAADGGRGVGAGVATALGGEAVEVRGLDVAQAVGGGVGRHVVGDDPDDIRWRRRRDGGRCAEGDQEKKRDREKAATEEHGWEAALRRELLFLTAGLGWGLGSVVGVGGDDWDFCGHRLLGGAHFRAAREVGPFVRVV